MAENIIYYGPPGTGKTHLIQKLSNKYIDYIITDNQIINAYTQCSENWILFSLILLQNGEKMKPTDIQSRISSLNLHKSINVSAELETHKIQPSSMGVIRKNPRIFFEYDNNSWYVDRNRILQYDPYFEAKFLSQSTINKRYIFVTFHQSFAYEDFVEGIRPTYNSNTNSIDYSPKPGVFKLICEEAEKHPEKDYAIFIDEINRGNISEIFGELISLIELDKRKNQANELSTTLPYSKDFFTVPNNLSIYGTMNSADKSIASIDIALRRRFKFAPLNPEVKVIRSELEIQGINAENIEGVNLIKLVETINGRIELLYDSNHLVGHSYFLSVKTPEDISIIIASKIIPLLEQYFFDDLQKIQLILGDLDEDGNLKSTAIYRHKYLLVENYFPYVGEYLLNDRKSYFINDSIGKDSLLQIYEGVTL